MNNTNTNLLKEQNIHAFGFYRIAAAVPPVTVGGCLSNTGIISDIITQCSRKSIDILVLPALSITSASCKDLFRQAALLSAAENALKSIIRKTETLSITVLVGLPLRIDDCLYNVIAVFSDGIIYGMVPLPYTEPFNTYTGKNRLLVKPLLQDTSIPFGTELLFKKQNSPCSFSIGIHTNTAGTYSKPAICFQPLAQPSTVTSVEQLLTKYTVLTDTQYNSVVYVNTGWSETSTDSVCAGEAAIIQHNTILAHMDGFEPPSGNTAQDSATDLSDLIPLIYADVDCTLPYSFSSSENTEDNYLHITLPDSPALKPPLMCPYNKVPFIPLHIQHNTQAKQTFFIRVLHLQARGLVKRMQHTHCKKMIIGISGGLDSTIALCAAVFAEAMMGQMPDSITAVTLPGFGTTNRTKNNACKLAELLGCTISIIPIRKALIQHFKDIGQPLDRYDTVYENAQARERTQILMDMANQIGALLVGTGDLSESALGWETYNGDHMSMYNVNAGIPKTMLQQYLLTLAANPALIVKNKQKQNTFTKIMQDILATPISPELLPADKQIITQKTETLLGPYELHDFFLYYILHTDFSPSKIFFLAEQTFCKEPAAYSSTEILTYMKLFYRRFFSQQFKRSCTPDGVSVGFGSLSPRTGLHMPSDISSEVWISELENLCRL